MKAFLLAAGEGRRLRPLTDSIPKCLVPIRGTPLLGIWLRLLETHGVTHVLVNVHRFREHVIEFLRGWPTSLVVETAYESRLVGTAGTVLANRDFVEGEERFLVLYADNLTTVDLGKMVRFHRDRAEPLTLGVVPTDTPREKGTVRIGRHGQVLEFAEKAPQPPSNLASGGIYVTGPGLFGHLPRSLPATGVLDFGYDILPRMVPHIAAYQIDEFLMDIGTPDAYARAEEAWGELQNRAGSTLAAGIR